MGLRIQTLPTAESQPTLSPGQLVAAGLMMPLAFAAVNQYLLNFQWDHPPDGPATAILWLLFVSHVAVISVVGAHLAQKSWQGWAVYAWCWLALDLQVMWASNYAQGEGVKTECLLLTALLAAQLGLVVIWSILGEQQWTIRVPVLLGLAIAITLLLRQQSNQNYYDVSYGVLFLIQILGLYAVGSLLRYRGLCLSWRDEGPRERWTSDWQFPAVQLGLREFIVAAALFAVILVAFEHWLSASQATAIRPLNLTLVGVLTASTMAVALWSALGAAPMEVRIAALLATCVLTASGCIVSDALFGDRSHEFHNSPSISHFWSHAFATRGWIFAWMFLSGGLLWAALLLLRMLGLRLQHVAPASLEIVELKSLAAQLPRWAIALLAKRA